MKGCKGSRSLSPRTLYFLFYIDSSRPLVWDRSPTAVDCQGNLVSCEFIRPRVLLFNPRNTDICRWGELRSYVSALAKDGRRSRNSYSATKGPATKARSVSSRLSTLRAARCAVLCTTRLQQSRSNPLQTTLSFEARSESGTLKAHSWGIRPTPVASRWLVSQTSVDTFIDDSPIVKSIPVLRPIFTQPYVFHMLLREKCAILV